MGIYIINIARTEDGDVLSHCVAEAAKRTTNTNDMTIVYTRPLELMHLIVDHYYYESYRKSKGADL